MRKTPTAVIVRPRSDPSAPPQGQGRKERSVPLWPTTSRTLRTWVAECGDSGDRILLPSASRLLKKTNWPQINADRRR
jgi:hypothetical protein